MTTREQTRRELKNLARLAEEMPNGHSSSIPPRHLPDSRRSGSGTSRITMPPTVASVPPPPPPRAARKPLASSGPSHTKSIPAALVAAAVAVGPSSEWRRGWLVAACSTVFAAMVSGLLLGQSLSSHAATGSTNESAHRGSTLGGIEMAGAAAPGFGGQAAGASLAQTVAPVSAAPSVLEVTGNCAPAATVRATRAPHHFDAKAAPRPVASTSSAITLAMKPSPAVRVSASRSGTARDSLDDLIRKAAGN
jgi:hypothetical protein